MNSTTPSAMNQPRPLPASVSGGDAMVMLQLTSSVLPLPAARAAATSEYAPRAALEIQRLRHPVRPCVSCGWGDGASGRSAVCWPRIDARRAPLMASEPAATTLRPRQRWLLIGIPVVLLFGRGVNALVELAMADTLPDRVGDRDLPRGPEHRRRGRIGRGRTLGWVLAVAILGWGLVGELGLWWFGSPDYVALALLDDLRVPPHDARDARRVHGSVAPMTDTETEDLSRRLARRRSTRRTSSCCAPSSRWCASRMASRSCR